MPTIPVPKARSRVSDTPAGLQIIIPAKKNWFLILFSGFWMIGWAFGEVFVLLQLVTGETPLFANLFLLAWLGAWTVAGAFIGYSWLWMIFGFERVLLRPGTLLIKRDLFGFGRNREHDLSHVKNLRVAPLIFNPFDFTSALQFWGIGGGIVAFDYGAKTFRFGASLDEAEANDIVAKLKARHAFNK